MGLLHIEKTSGDGKGFLRQKKISVVQLKTWMLAVLALIVFHVDAHAATLDVCYKTNSELDLGNNSNTRLKLTNPNYFGTSGTAAIESFNFHSLASITASTLSSNNCDIFFGGGSPQLPISEATAIQTWVGAGSRFLIAGCDYFSNTICSTFGRGLTANSNGGVSINTTLAYNPLTCGGALGVGTFGGASTYHGTNAGDEILALHDGAPAGQTAAAITDGLVAPTFLFTADADMYGSSGSSAIGLGATATTDQAKLVVNSFKYAADAIGGRLVNPQCFNSYDQTADLAIASSLTNSSLLVGEQTTVSFTVTNETATATTDVAVTIILPAGVSYQSQSGDGTYVDSNNQWTIGSLAGNATATITLTVEATATSTSNITAEITNSSLADTDSATNSSFATDDKADGIADDDETSQAITTAMGWPTPPVSGPGDGGECVLTHHQNSGVAADPNSFYNISDHTNPNTLTKIGPWDVASGTVEGLTADVANNVFYALNADRGGSLWLGEIDPLTGSFSDTTTTGASTISHSVYGSLSIFQSRAIAHQPATNELWVAAYDAQPPSGPGDTYIYLFKISTSTGEVLTGVFGGEDYIAVDLAPYTFNSSNDRPSVEALTFYKNEPDILYGVLSTLNGGTPKVGHLFAVDISQASPEAVLAPSNLSGVSYSGGAAPSSDYYDIEGMSFDKNGDLVIVSANVGGANANSILTVSLATGIASNKRSITSGDWEGIVCDPFFPEKDYGDIPTSGTAPDGSSTTAYGETSHIIVSGIYLGSSDPDKNATHQPSVNADSDDNDGVDDEDGIVIPTLTQGQTATITATVAGTGGYLQGWIDFNGDGDFLDAGEQVVTDLQDGGGLDTDITAGTIAFDVVVPSSATANPTYARFRWSTVQNLDSTTAASDGEVEDYLLSMTPLSCSASLLGGFNLAGDATADANNQIILTDDNLGALSAAYQSKQGQAWSNEKISLLVPFSLDFSVYLGIRDGSETGVIGADGIAFAFHNDPAGKNAVGVSGAGLGVGGLDPAIAIEFDTWVGNTSGANDPNNGNAPDHTNIFDPQSYTTNSGAGASELLSSVVELDNIEDDQWHNISLTWDPGTTTLVYSLDGNVIETLVRDIIAMDFAGDPLVHYGVAASTGTGYNLQKACFQAAPPPVTLDYSDIRLTGKNYGDASHIIASGIQIGATVTSEAVGYDSTDADGDSDDGITLPTLTQGQTATIIATVAGSGGYLQAWIDWNGDGDFLDTIDGISEQISINAQDNITAVFGRTDDSDSSAGQISLAVMVPASAITTQTYARFRWSTTLDLDSATSASDGEVEDYAVTVRPLPPPIAECTDTSGYFKNPNLSNYSCVTGGSNFGNAITDWDLILGTAEAFIHDAPTCQWRANPEFLGGTPIVSNLLPYSGVVYGGLHNYGGGFGGIYTYPREVIIQNLATNLPAGLETEMSFASAVTDFTGGGAGINQFGNAGTWQVYGIRAGASYTPPSGAAACTLESNASVDLLGQTDVISSSTWQGASISFTTIAAYDRIIFSPTCGVDSYLLFDCLTLKTPDVDYSDAPDASYGSAAHTIVSGIYLGSVEPDAENAPPQGGDAGVGADGDDTIGVDDEDGVTLPILTQGQDSNITATVSGAGGFLQGWIDFNGNGSFDAIEQVVADLQDGGALDTDVNTGSITFNINIPADATTNQTYARFRWSTTSGLDNTAAASDGEVEDYAVTIKVGGFPVKGRVFNDADINGVNDSAEKGISGLPVVLLDVINNTCVSTKTDADGNYTFFPVVPGDYRLYEASRETIPTPQNCDVSLAKDPANYRSTTMNAFSQFSVVDAEITGKDFGDIKEPLFSPDNSGTILPGNVVFYAHKFTATSTGSVNFTSSDSGSVTTGWSSLIYQDFDCNGQLESAEAAAPIANDLVTIAGQDICLINKVYAPAGVSAGETFINNISADFNFNNNILAGTTTLKVTDISKAAANDPVLGSSRLELRKTVQNITQSSAETETQNQAKPGDILQYRIYYSNTGTGVITDLKINDAVPAFTTINGSPLCDAPLPASLTSCTPTINGNDIEWVFPTSDELDAGSQGAVSYKVIIE